MQPGIQWSILVTDKYRDSLHFYRDILELQVDRKIDDEEFCQFTLPYGFLAIYGRKQVEKLLSPAFLNTAGGAIYSFPESHNLDEDSENYR